MVSRLYATRRQVIIDALVDQLKKINKTGDFLTNVYENVKGKLEFWDDISEFPAIHINAGSERRDYQGGGAKDRYMSVTIRCYVKEEDPQNALDALLEDVETVVEDASCMRYTDRQGKPQRVKNMTVVSIDTDEGILDPIGVGEMLIEIMY